MILLLKDPVKAGMPGVYMTFIGKRGFADA